MMAWPRVRPYVSAVLIAFCLLAAGCRTLQRLCSRYILFLVHSPA